MSFPLFPPYRIACEGDVARAPPHFAGTERNPWESAARKLAALERVLAQPLRYAARMARKLPRQLMVIGWQPSRTPPRGPAFEIWEEKVRALREAWGQLRDYRRRRRDIEARQTPAS